VVLLRGEVWWQWPVVAAALDVKLSLYHARSRKLKAELQPSTEVQIMPHCPVSFERALFASP
jgi:hypothetical protein